jgi:hypothetical protein
MKTTHTLVGAIVAPLLISGLANAGQSTSTAAQPAAASGITGYVEVSGVTGSGTLNAGGLGGLGGLGSFLGGPAPTEGEPTGGGEISEDVSGARVNGGLLFGNGLSLDGRFENVDSESGINLQQARVLLNYTQEIAPGVSAFAGAGYGAEQSELLIIDLNSQAILANVGITFTSGQFFGTLVYTHAFTTSTTMNLVGQSTSMDEIDVGYLEANVGYNLTEKLSAVASIETQVTGDSMIQKDWLAGLGLRFGF